MPLRGRVRLSRHQHRGLIETDVAERDGGVTPLEVVVDPLVRPQPGDRAVLPVDRRDVAGDVLQQLVAEEERPLAEFEPLLEDSEVALLVPAGEDPDLGKVQADHAHIESAVEDILPLLILPGREEAAAAHWGEDVALIDLPHLLRRDIVGVHAAGGALRRQLGEVVVLAVGVDVVLVEDVDELGESGRHVDVRLILDPLEPLPEDLLGDQRRLTLVLVPRPEVHEEGDKGRLPIRRHEGIDLVLDRLDAVLHLLLRPLPRHLLGLLEIGLYAVDLLLVIEGVLEILVEAPSHVGCEDAVDAVDRLAAVLTRGDLGDDLRRDGAGDLEALGAVDLLPIDAGAAAKHVLEVDQAAIEHRLDDVVHIVEVDRAAVVRHHDVCRHKESAGDILGDLAGDQVTLRGDDLGVLIRVLVHHATVGLIEDAEDAGVVGIALALKFLHRPVALVRLGGGDVAVHGQLVVDHLLYRVYRHRCADDGGIALYLVGDLRRLTRLVDSRGGVHRLLDGDGDLALVEGYAPSVPLDHLEKGGCRVVT